MPVRLFHAQDPRIFLDFPSFWIAGLTGRPSYVGTPRRLAVRYHSPRDLLCLLCRSASL
jgi:hypothetical protein